jgi:hypothetical protein
MVDGRRGKSTQTVGGVCVGIARVSEINGGEMKKTIEVGASFGGKIPSGSYENMAPNFFAKEVFEAEGTEIEIQDLIKRRQDELHIICLQNFEGVALKARIQKIQNDRKDFRFYPVDGEEYISVTSVLNYDANFYVEPEELKQYAAQGTIIDIQVKHFVNTGVWVKDVKELEGIGAELFIVTSGSLGLTLDGWDFPAFLKKYELKDMTVGVPVFNREHRYAGTPDIICTYNGLKTVVDIKRNVTSENKVKYLAQCSAYGKCVDAQQSLLCILNDKTEQGFSKPIISTEVDKYFDVFLNKRREFKKVYSI